MKKLFAGFSVSLMLLAGILTGCGSSGGDSGDQVPPTVLAVFPINGSKNVARNVKLTASFDMKMLAASITAESFTVSGPDGKALAGVGKLAPDGLSAVFIPSTSFAVSTKYTAKLTTAVKRLEGEALEKDYVWSFTTGLLPDTAAPTVLSTVPADGATGVGLNADVTAIFSEVMDPLTITSSSVTLKKGGSAVAGVVTAPLTSTVSFNPNAALSPSTIYTATISTLVKDAAGNAMATAKTWTFTTRPLSALGPDPIDLKTAGNYVTLSQAATTNIPTSDITGDIGISPIQADGGFVGFASTRSLDGTFATSAQVDGKLYAADFTAPTPLTLVAAMLDMKEAYDTVALLPPPPAANINVGGGAIGGLTLAPGLYQWTSAVVISDDLTLAGSDNDVWIFQINGTLDVASAKSIIRSGNSLPKNIFWQVTGAVNLGANSHFEGIILGATNINLNTGASINGRLYAQTALNLDSSVVTQPAP